MRRSTEIEPLLTPGFFIALLCMLVFFAWFATKLVDERWDYCQATYPKDKYKVQKCYIEGFNHGPAKKN